MKLMKWLGSIAVVLALVACSGGGGSPGANVNGGGNGGSDTGATPSPNTPPVGTTPSTTETSAVSDFIVSLDKSAIKNDGADEARLTVTTLNANNNIVTGARVAVQTDSGSVFAPPPLQQTDSSGKYVGVVSGGSDKTNRVIGVKVTVNGVTKTASLRVQGSKLSLSVIPSVASAGGAMTITARLTDANGVAIPDATVNLTGVVATSVTTDSNGDAIVGFNAPAAAGTYNVNAASSGVQAISGVVVGATIPFAVIPAGVAPSFAINPTVLAPNAVGSSSNQALLRFLLLDATNTPIPNVRVRFEKAGQGLGYDGVVSSGAAAVITNASGIATSAYISGTESSPTNGVALRACYKATDFTSDTDCPNFVVQNLTIAGSPVAISISDNDGLEKGIGTYTQRFAVSVVDSAGRAVANAPVSYSVDITHFGKGDYALPITMSLSPEAINLAIPPDLTTNPVLFGRRVLCPNEDTNRSNNLDPSEDINNSGALEPAKSDVSIASDQGGAIVTTDASGIAVLKVTWLQKVATWLVYRVRVTTNVSASESRAESSFPTYFVKGDDEDAAPFKIPPYGTGACIVNG